MRRAGFALIELALVIGIIGTVTGLAIPLYRDYQIRNDLNLATGQVTQGLARARLLSQSGQGDSAWGFYVPSGTLYKGTSYATRDTTKDEIYSMPSTIMMTGLHEVSYSKLKGTPSGTGAITLIALNQDSRTILIVVQSQSVAVVQGDTLTICANATKNNPHTIKINDNAWPAHQAQGDTLGACPGSSAASVASAASSASSAAAGAGAGAGAGTSGGGTCADRFSVAADGTITTTGPLSIIFQSLGAQFGYGNGGPDVPVYVSYKKKSNGNSWTNIFSGNAINGNGGASQTVTGFQTGDNVILRYWASFSQHGWLSYDRKITSTDGNQSVIILHNGDTAPTITASNGQKSVSALLSSVTVNGKISIGTYDLILLGDFNRQDVSNCENNDAYCTNGQGVDYQDGIVWVKFQTPSC